MRFILKINYLRRYKKIGLDSYLFKRGITAKGKILIGLEKESHKRHIEVGYWRKSWILHEQFMSYDVSGDVDLNCKDIPLSKKDLKDMLDWIFKRLKLPFKTHEEYDKEDLINANEIITKLLKETDFKNEQIVYYAWW